MNFFSNQVLHEKDLQTRWCQHELHWKLREPSGNLQNPTQMLSYNEMNNQPLHLANIEFSSIGSSFWAARTVSYTAGWGSVNEQLGCGLPTTTHPPFTTPHWYKLDPVGLENTRILTDYVQKCPRTLLSVAWPAHTFLPPDIKMHPKWQYMACLISVGSDIQLASLYY